MGGKGREEEEGRGGGREEEKIHTPSLVTEA